VSALEAEQLSPVADLLNSFADEELPRNTHSQALAASLVVCTFPAYLYSFTVCNTKATSQFVQFHDATALPADGAIPAVVFSPAGTSDKTVPLGIPGRLFLYGIVVCNSSTAGSKTIGAADCFFDVQFLPVHF